MKVIAGKNLPTRLPITQSIVVLLLVERHPPGPVWLGVILTFGALIWIAAIIAWWTQDETELKELK